MSFSEKITVALQTRANYLKKSRIVVNGKEYERLEDVPEPFRSKLKDNVSCAIPGIAKLVTREKSAWNIPSISFSFSSQSEPLDSDPNVPVAPPDGFQFEDKGLERLISWRWISWQTLGATVFITLWDVVMAFVLHAICSSKNAFKGAPLWVPLAIVALIAVGISMTYAVAAYLVNRTSVQLRSGQVSVWHGPLPWFGEKDVTRADIARVWSEKIGQVTDEDTAFVPAVSYAVKLLLKAGKTLNLVSGLLAPEQALFIEQQIRKH